MVRSPAEVKASKASGLVLPGVGALRDCVASLRGSRLDKAVGEWIAADRPFLGVCLGMQALFESSEEEQREGAGNFRGKVVRFRRAPEFKIPHIGWNTLRFVQRDSPLAAGFSGGEAFYFVHSFYCEPADPALVRWRNAITAAPSPRRLRSRVFATQFHPEKSQARGLQIYRNFAAVAGKVA